MEQSSGKTKKAPQRNAEGLLSLVAEREGFEPPVPLGTMVFKTIAIDHSAISPWAKKKQFSILCKGN